MDIHKPKPWHSVREFLKEYLIIVVGIVTALGGEAAVEGLHWREVAQEAREAMAPNERNLVRDAGERDAQSVCLAAEFRRIRATLDEASATGWIPTTASIRNPTRRAWTIGTYDSVVSGQVLPHFPVQERVVVVSVNAWSQYLQRNRDVEVKDWSVLRSLEGPRRKTGESELANLRAALSEATYQAGVMRIGSRDMAQRIADHGVLSRREVRALWDQGFKQGRDGLIGACAAGETSDTDQLLQQLETPMKPAPDPTYRSDRRGAG